VVALLSIVFQCSTISRLIFVPKEDALTRPAHEYFSRAEHKLLMHLADLSYTIYIKCCCGIGWTQLPDVPWTKTALRSLLTRLSYTVIEGNKSGQLVKKIFIQNVWSMSILLNKLGQSEVNFKSWKSQFIKITAYYYYCTIILLQNLNFINIRTKHFKQIRTAVICHGRVVTTQININSIRNKEPNANKFSITKRYFKFTFRPI